MSEEFTFLLDHLADESRPVRTLNLAPLSDLPRALLPRFRAAWQAFAPRRRLELIHVMVEQAEVNIHLCFHAVFRECLADADAQVRRLAIEGLWEDERTSLVSPLVTLLAADPAAEVRAAAAVSLGRFMLMGVLGELSDGYAAQVKRALTAAWNRPGETTEVRRRALEGLAYLNEQALYALMDSAYYDEDELMRQSAIFAMGRSADPRWAKYVLAELGSVEAAMRFEAASAAGELGLGGAVKPLIRLLDDPDSHVREATILALGKIGGPAAKRALQACQRSKDERMAEAAGEALEELAFNSDLDGDTAAGGRRSDDSAAPDEDVDEDDDLDDEDEEDYDDDLLGEEFGLGDALDGFDDIIPAVGDEDEDEDDEWDDDDDEDAEDWDGDDDDSDELDEDESWDAGDEEADDDDDEREGWR